NARYFMSVSLFARYGPNGGRGHPDGPDISPTNFCRSIIPHFERLDERLLGNLHLAELAHLLFPLLLFFKELALARRVAAIAFGGHVLAHRPHRLAGDDAPADGGLDGD